MRVIDGDAHVVETPLVFSEEYLDPNFRSQCPSVVEVDGVAHWVIDEQLFPRRVGPGCNNLSTPASYEGRPARHGAWVQSQNFDSLESQQLTDVKARLHAMDAEEIFVQVLYSTLFLAYPLSSNVPLVTALCSSWNRWMGSQLSGNERLKWAAVVNLNDIPGAVREVHEARRLGAVSVMVLGTIGNHMLDHPSFFPFYEAVEEEDLALGVHVGWAWPSLNNLYSHLYPSTVAAFLMPVLMGFVSLMTGGVLDRFANLRVVFLEAGSLWIPFMVDRLNHRFGHINRLSKAYPQVSPPKAEVSPMEYLQRGNLYFTAEVEDSILPQVIELVGEKQIVFASDMPHGDRDRFASRLLRDRKDLSASAKSYILENNPCRLYKLDLPAIG